MMNDWLPVLQLTRVERRLEPRSDLVERRARGEDPRDASQFQGRDVVVRDDAADDQEDVLTTLTLQEVDDARHEDEMRPRQERETEDVGVLLDDGLDDLLRCLVKSGVDDFETGVPQRPRDDLRAPIVSIETGFGDYDSLRALHQ